jgi:hypothetical protein
MWSAASMPFRRSRAQDPAPTGATPRAMAKVVPGKGDDQAQGLAEQSVSTSIVHPTQSGRDDPDQGARPTGNRTLTDNDQREGLEKTDPDSPKADDRHRL